MFTSLPVNHEPMVTPAPPMDSAVRTCCSFFSSPSLPLPCTSLASATRKKNWRRRPSELLAKSGMELIETEPLYPHPLKPLNPFFLRSSLNPFNPFRPAPVMEAVLPPPAPQDD